VPFERVSKDGKELFVRCDRHTASVKAKQTEMGACGSSGRHRVGRKPVTLPTTLRPKPSQVASDSIKSTISRSSAGEPYCTPLDGSNCELCTPPTYEFLVSEETGFSKPGEIGVCSNEMAELDSPAQVNDVVEPSTKQFVDWISVLPGHVAKYCLLQDIFSVAYTSKVLLFARFIGSALSVIVVRLSITPIIMDSLYSLARSPYNNFSMLGSVLTTLQELDTGHVSINGSAMKCVLSNARQLRHLHLRRATSGAIAELCHASRISDSLLSLSIGTVGMYMYLSDTQLSDALRLLGSNLTVLKFQNVCEMSCSVFRAISNHCDHLKELSIVSCNDINSSWKLSSAVVDDFQAMISSIGSEVEVLDFRYSLQMSDLLLRILCLNISNRRFRCFLGSRTEAGAHSSASVHSLSHKRWKQFSNMFLNAELLFMDNVTGTNADLEVKYIFQAEPFKKASMMTFDWATVRSAAAWKECKCVATSHCFIMFSFRSSWLAAVVLSAGPQAQ
jgi:hypothetical protein